MGQDRGEVARIGEDMYMGKDRGEVGRKGEKKWDRIGGRWQG